MAQNKYNISVHDIATRFSGNTENVYRMDLYVTDVAGQGVASLVSGDFLLGGSKTFSFDNASSVNGYYTFTTANFKPSTGDYEYAQVSHGETFSDKLFLDFMNQCSNSEANVKFILPSQTGEYKIGLDKVNERDFATVQSSQLRGNENITTANSKVQVYKSYLTHFAGETVSLKVTIGKGDSATLELSMKADKQ